MARRIFSDSDIDYIIKEHFVSHRTIRNISKEFGVTDKVITRLIASMGRIYWTENTWRFGAICLKACIALYKYGIGLRGVAERMDVPLGLLRAEFNRQGVKLRTQSEQEIIKWKLMDTSQREHQVKAAHDATRGKPVSREQLLKTALTRSRRSSVYEDAIADDFRSAGIIFEEQFPIDIYNIDFVVGNVAVEIFGGEWHGHGAHAARFPERSKKIFDAGYSLLILNIGKHESFTNRVRSDFVEFVKVMSVDKSSIGKYRVVWCTLNCVSFGSRDDIDIAMVRPTRNIRDRETGRYVSVAR